MKPLSILAISLLASVLPGTPARAAEPYAPPELLGTRVEWLGQIENQVREGDNTCFTLRGRIDRLRGPIESAPRFTACAYGVFEPALYPPGSWLRITGTLAPQRDDLPQVRFAIVKRSESPPQHYYYPDHPARPYWP
jgi:hypothetical protein